MLKTKIEETLESVRSETFHRQTFLMLYQAVSGLVKICFEPFQRWPEAKGVLSEREAQGPPHTDFHKSVSRKFLFTCTLSN